MIYIFKIYFWIISILSKDVNKVHAVVFSKDRPLQLEALLLSISEKSITDIPLTILYAVSDEKYKKAYKELINRYEGHNYILEKNFKKDLLSILKKIKSTKVVFLVDDIVFTKKFNINHFINNDLSISVPSLRLGKNITYSYMKNKELVQPEFTNIENKLIEWNWINNNSYWSYPLSLDGHIFNKYDVLSMFKLIKFWSPNSLEGNIQRFNKIFMKKKGCSFENSILVNFPWNKVQLDNNNKSGVISSEYLLELWDEGKRVDVEKYYDKVYKSAHVEEELYII